jgi:hypothetical protein
MRMTTLAIVAGLCCSGVALGATVTIEKPTQAQTTRSGLVDVSVSLSDDFQAGQDGWVDLWVDGAYVMTLKGTKGTLNLSPGNHQIQARLVTLDHQPLRIAANSDRVLVTVPSVSP